MTAPANVFELQKTVESYRLYKKHHRRGCGGLLSHRLLKRISNTGDSVWFLTTTWVCKCSTFLTQVQITCSVRLSSFKLIREHQFKEGVITGANIFFTDIEYPFKVLGCGIRGYFFIHT